MHLRIATSDDIDDVIAIAIQRSPLGCGQTITLDDDHLIWLMKEFRP